MQFLYRLHGVSTVIPLPLCAAPCRLVLLVFGAACRGDFFAAGAPWRLGRFMPVMSPAVGDPQCSAATNRTPPGVGPGLVARL